MRTIRNTSVAVVGGAGFLGSHTVDHLINDRGCSVLVLDNLVAGRKEFIHPQAKFEHCDITGSENRLHNLFKWNNVQYVFNLAAHPYVPLSYDRPLHVFDTNALGAMQVINAAQEAGCEGILQVSSAELYGHGPFGNHLGKITEESSVLPHSSYGAAKAAIDYFVQCRWREAETPCIALRQFNCVGEKETHPYVIPEIIGQLAAQQEWADMGMIGMITQEVPGKRKFEKGRVLDIKAPHTGTVRLGNNSFRDFLYAGDQARMAVELLEKGAFGEVYNLGSESGIKIYDLAVLIGKVMGFADVTVEEDSSRFRRWEIWHLMADCTKINSVIDCRPQVPLEEALKRTVSWYESNGRKWPWEK